MIMYNIAHISKNIIIPANMPTDNKDQCAIIYERKFANNIITNIIKNNNSVSCSDLIKAFLFKFNLYYS